MAFVLVVGALAGGGCSSKQSPVGPQVELGTAVLEGRVLRFSSTEPGRASVLYGFAPGEYDHVAYPIARDRRDLSYLRQHEVPLLDLREGQDVFLRTRVQLSDGREALSDEVRLSSTTGPAPDLLVSTMVHIGWGDAHLLTMPHSGKRIMIDAGEPEAAAGLADWLASHGVDRIDVALATHIHADHIGGFVGDDVNHDGVIDVPGILDLWSPERWLDSPEKTHQRFLYDETRQLLQSEVVPTVFLRRGDSSEDHPALSDWDPAVQVLVLNSGLADDVSVDSYDGNNINNESIVLRISYGDVDLVIGGDCEFESEASILADFPPETLDAEFYKSHHHGRQDGGSEAFLRALRPRVSFVPVSWKEYAGGMDEYLRESAPQTGRLDRLQIDRFGIDDQPPRKTGLTDRSYNVSFVTDGRSYEVRVEWARQNFGRTTAGVHHDCDRDVPAVRVHPPLGGLR